MVIEERVKNGRGKLFVSNESDRGKQWDQLINNGFSLVHALVHNCTHANKEDHFVRMTNEYSVSDASQNGLISRRKEDRN